MTSDSALKLPPIALATLPEATKDWILGRASFLACSPEQVMLDVLDRAAARQAGTTPGPAVDASSEGLAA